MTRPIGKQQLSKMAYDYLQATPPDMMVETVRAYFPTSISIAYTEGMDARVNAAWHEASDTPIPDEEQILFEVDGEAIVGYFGHWHGDGLYFSNGGTKYFISEVARWAYIKDLLPTGKGGAQ